MKKLETKTKPGAPPGSAHARKGEKDFDANLHARCYREEKAAWLQAAKRSHTGKLTAWAREVLNRESGLYLK